MRNVLKLRPATLGAGLLLLAASTCSHKLTGPTPTIEKENQTFCGGLNTTFTIKGTGFSPLDVKAATSGAAVELPQVCFEIRQNLDGTPATGNRICLPQDKVQWVSPTQIRFVLSDASGLKPGLYEVIVLNPDGKEARNMAMLRVLPEGPLVFFADPPVTYSGISTQMTVYGAGLMAGIATVALRIQAGMETMVDYTVDPMHPNRFRVSSRAAPRPASTTSSCGTRTGVRPS